MPETPQNSDELEISIEQLAEKTGIPPEKLRKLSSKASSDMPLDCPTNVDLTNSVCLSCDRKDICTRALEIEYMKSVIQRGNKAKIAKESKTIARRRKKKRVTDPATPEFIDKYGDLVAQIQAKLEDVDVLPQGALGEYCDHLIGFTTVYLDNYQKFEDEDDGKN